MSRQKPPSAERIPFDVCADELFVAFSRCWSLVLKHFLSAPARAYFFKFQAGVIDFQDSITPHQQIAFTDDIDFVAVAQKRAPCCPSRYGAIAKKFQRQVRRRRS